MSESVAPRRRIVAWGSRPSANAASAIPSAAASLPVDSNPIPQAADISKSKTLYFFSVPIIQRESNTSFKTKVVLALFRVNGVDEKVEQALTDLVSGKVTLKLDGNRTLFGHNILNKEQENTARAATLLNKPVVFTAQPLQKLEIISLEDALKRVSDKSFSKLFRVSFHVLPADAKTTPSLYVYINESGGMSSLDDPLKFADAVNDALKAEKVGSAVESNPIKLIRDRKVPGVVQAIPAVAEDKEKEPADLSDRKAESLPSPASEVKKQAADLPKQQPSKRKKGGDGRKQPAARKQRNAQIAERKGFDGNPVKISNSKEVAVGTVMTNIKNYAVNIETRAKELLGNETYTEEQKNMIKKEIENVKDDLESAKQLHEKGQKGERKMDQTLLDELKNIHKSFMKIAKNLESPSKLFEARQKAQNVKNQRKALSTTKITKDEMERVASRVLERRDDIRTQAKLRTTVKDTIGSKRWTGTTDEWGKAHENIWDGLYTEKFQAIIDERANRLNQARKAGPVKPDEMKSAIDNLGGMSKIETEKQLKEVVFKFRWTKPTQALFKKAFAAKEKEIEAMLEKWVMTGAYNATSTIGQMKEYLRSNGVAIATKPDKRYIFNIMEQSVIRMRDRIVRDLIKAKGRDKVDVKDVLDAFRENKIAYIFDDDVVKDQDQEAKKEATKLLSSLKAATTRKTTGKKNEPFENIVILDKALRIFHDNKSITTIDALKNRVQKAYAKTWTLKSGDAAWSAIAQELEKPLKERLDDMQKQKNTLSEIKQDTSPVTAAQMRNVVDILLKRGNVPIHITALKPKIVQHFGARWTPQADEVWDKSKKELQALIEATDDEPLKDDEKKLYGTILAIAKKVAERLGPKVTFVDVYENVQKELKSATPPDQSLVNMAYDEVKLMKVKMKVEDKEEEKHIFPTFSYERGYLLKEEFKKYNQEEFSHAAEPIIKRAAFRRLLLQLTLEKYPDIKYSAPAVDAIQEVVERYITKHFEKVNLSAIHAGRKYINMSDLFHVDKMFETGRYKTLADDKTPAEVNKYFRQKAEAAQKKAETAEKKAEAAEKKAEAAEKKAEAAEKKAEAPVATGPDIINVDGEREY